MGGNVTIKGENATPINLRKFDRETIREKIMMILTMVQILSKSKNDSVWDDLIFNNNNNISKIFAGSSVFLMWDAYTTEEILMYKPVFGDIDIQCPKEKDHVLETILKDMPKILDISLIGYKKSNSQFITLWYIGSIDCNIQIDFELVEFEHGVPSAWSQFSHSSSWVDIKCGFTGVFHKLALRALCARGLEEYLIFDPASSKIVEQWETKYAFSVTHGLRKKLEIFKLDYSELAKVVYKKIPKNEWKYSTNISEIFEVLIPQDNFVVHNNVNVGKDALSIEDFYSFNGILKLVLCTFSNEEKKTFVHGFYDLLYGERSQAISKNKELDAELKRNAINYVEEFLKVEL